MSLQNVEVHWLIVVSLFFAVDLAVLEWSGETR